MSSLISVATSVIEYGLLKSVLILANIRYHSPDFVIAYPKNLH